jgi:hypothetical protein
MLASNGLVCYTSKAAGEKAAASRLGLRQKSQR